MVELDADYKQSMTPPIKEPGMRPQTHPEPDRPREELRTNGIVYTPPAFADFVAGKVVQHFLKDATSASPDAVHSSSGTVDPTEWRVLDPACGRGELLAATWSEMQAVLDQTRAFDAYGELEPLALLCGIDNDRVAAVGARERLRNLDPKGSTTNGKPKIVNTNALFPYNRAKSRWGWTEMLDRLDAPRGFDIVIANPPWGADFEDCKEKLHPEEFTLAHGQYDSAELFLELSLAITRQHGYIAFIMPDSLFAKERSAVRSLLLRELQIKFVGRFGEKIFDDVNRGCGVVIGKVKSPPQHETTCLRLTPPIRRRILSGEITFSEAERELAHTVPQRRFAGNPYFLFDIDVTSDDESLLSKIEEAGGHLSSFLTSTRGVELSKTGKVYQCEHCDVWMPFPRTTKPTCSHCGEAVQLFTTRVDHLVADEPKPGYAQLVAGEDVTRYLVRHQKWIDVERSGINYKSLQQYAPPKLLVRKTGVGISAAVDYSNALTNQVVYILKPLCSGESALPIELFQAILSSRAMYYYLVKRFGETEWRSHPYVTQSQVLELPAPSEESLSMEHPAVQRIVRLVTECANTGEVPCPRTDAQIERDVAELYGLDAGHYGIIYDTLSAVEDLLPVRALKTIDIQDIFRE